jgi:hypothetical protein
MQLGGREMGRGFTTVLLIDGLGTCVESEEVGVTVVVGKYCGSC